MSEPTNSDEKKSENQSDKIENESLGYFNLKFKTLGGQHFWTDVRYVGGWRIQNNSETGHYRLIDSNNVRHAWGDYQHCSQLLDQQINAGVVKPDTGKVVIALHGLIRTSASMESIADYLQANGAYAVINFQYASTRNSVGDHAVALKNVIDQLGLGVTEINFVGHSLGNIVVRRYLGDQAKNGLAPDARIKRMVMIGPPNQGSRMARILKSSFLFKTIAGVSGSELSRTWEQIEPTLATPSFEFGIIAGGQQTDEDFSNFILKGKDDFTVSVDETRLAGANDFLVQPLLHSTMMKRPEVLQASLNFFQNGYFISPEKRTPIPAVETNRQSELPVFRGNR